MEEIKLTRDEFSKAMAEVTTWLTKDVGQQTGMVLLMTSMLFAQKLEEHLFGDKSEPQGTA